MEKYLIKLVLFFGVPVFVLVVSYIVSDPFGTLRPFSIEKCYVENRDNISTELFLMNDSIYHYNSFIFGSCRSCRVNSYHWKKYLPEGSNQYVFQAWGETITGIRNKLKFLDEYGSSINNVLLLIDIPNTLGESQTSTDAILIQSPKTTKMPIWKYQSILFCDYAQKPSIWPVGYKRMLRDTVKIPFDLVTNDWSKVFADMDVNVCPPQDSMLACNGSVRYNFFAKIDKLSDDDLKEAEPQISDDIFDLLNEIHCIFVKHQSKYKVIITPAFCYTSPAVNQEDYKKLISLFGNDNVFDFSHKNELNSDYNNFYDPGHFGLCVGWRMIEKIYNHR